MQLDNVLVVTHDVDANIFLAARNVHRIDVIGAEDINPVSLIEFDKVLITSSAIKQIEEKLA